MSEQPPSPPLQIDPSDVGLLRADYWGGVTIRGGEPDRLPWTPHRTLWSGREATRGLKEFYERGGNGVALETFQAGYAFSVDEQTPGSVFLMHAEQLISERPVDAKLIQVLGAKAPKPERPLTSGGHNKILFSPFDLGLEYDSYTALGIVAHGARGHNILYKAYKHVADAQKGVSRGDVKPDAGQVVVGQTEHWVAPNGNQLLRRVNRIERVMAGHAKRRRIRLPLGTLSLKPNTAEGRV